jgi:glycosyltransferase involved in cell wall biosynthesis
MKICFLCAEYPPVPHGGAGTFTQVTARALVRAGHQVRVAGLYGSDCAQPEHSDDHGVDVWRLRAPRYRGGWLAGRIALFRLVKRWVQQGAVQIVDAPDHEGPFAGWPALSAPLVLRAGGSYSYFLHELGKPIPWKTFHVERASYRRADAWIAKSEYIGGVTQRLFNLPPADATLYNPVDVPATAPPIEARTKNDVVFTGTLTAKKGVIPLIDGWPTVHAQVADACLHVYGKDGISPAGSSMTTYLQDRLPVDCRASVRFHGHVDRTHVVAALAAARVAVFPSFAEGFAWAPLEAMAAGCPTIYARTGSGPELMVDGRDGLLVAPDDPAGIAAAIARVLRDDLVARRLGEGGRSRIVSTFGLETLLPANEAFYAGLLGAFAGKNRNGHDRPTHRAA